MDARIGGDRLIAKKELRVLLGGVTDMTIGRWVKAGRLPQPIRLPGARPRWSALQVMEALGLTDPAEKN